MYHSYENKKIEKSRTERTSSTDFKRELNFSPEQTKAFDELAAKFRENTREVLVEMHNVRMELIKEMSSTNPDQAKMFAMADEIGLMHAQIKRQTIDHFLILKKDSTPEQFERFIKFFQRSLMDDNFGRWSKGQGQNRRSKNKRSERNK